MDPKIYFKSLHNITQKSIILLKCPQYSAFFKHITASRASHAHWHPRSTRHPPSRSSSSFLLAILWQSLRLPASVCQRPLAAVRCRRRPLRGPVPCRRRPLRGPVPCRQRPLLGPVRCRQPPLLGPVRCRQRPLLVPLRCRRRPLQVKVLCRRRPVLGLVRCRAWPQRPINPSRAPASVSRVRKHHATVDAPTQIRKTFRCKCVACLTYKVQSCTAHTALLRSRGGC